MIIRLPIIHIDVWRMRGDRREVHVSIRRNRSCRTLWHSYWRSA